MNMDRKNGYLLMTKDIQETLGVRREGLRLVSVNYPSNVEVIG